MIQKITINRAVLVTLPAVSVFGVTGFAQKPASLGAEIFWSELEKLCGRAFAGSVVVDHQYYPGQLFFRRVF